MRRKNVQHTFPEARRAGSTATDARPRSGEGRAGDRGLDGVPLRSRRAVAYDVGEGNMDEFDKFLTEIRRRVPEKKKRGAARRLPR